MGAAFGMMAIVSGCANKPKPDDPCKTEYAYMDARCNVKRKPTEQEMKAAGYVKFCHGRSQMMQCGWVRPEDLQRAFEGR